MGWRGVLARNGVRVPTTYKGSMLNPLKFRIMNTEIIELFEALMMFFAAVGMIAIPIILACKAFRMSEYPEDYK